MDQRLTRAERGLVNLPGCLIPLAIGSLVASLAILYMLAMSLWFSLIVAVASVVALLTLMRSSSCERASAKWDAIQDGYPSLIAQVRRIPDA